MEYKQLEFDFGEDQRDLGSLTSECDVLDTSLDDLTKAIDYTITAGMIGVNGGLVTWLALAGTKFLIDGYGF
ncbi:hypothetical protein CL618_00515 [archaeon]|nr:hypothetical protein [archaeon]|tara:strand:+ start:38 stop:253 length:216 start_codon:yes stop_codon:yes gene_type:complete